MEISIHHPTDESFYDVRILFRHSFAVKVVLQP
jgi:hypothetical protein